MAGEKLPRGVFWKVGLTLYALALLGAALVLPYVLALERGALAAAAARSHLAIGILLAVSFAQSALLLAIAVFAGLWAARKLGLGAPILAALYSRSPLPQRTAATLTFAIAAGLVTGGALIALDRYVFMPMPSVAAFIAQARHAGAQPSPWQGFLASFYGGLDEEILMRLGLLSLLGLFLRMIAGGRADGRALLPGGVFWTANIVTALLFGAGHLPAAAAIAPLTAALTLRVVALNALGGLVFGWLYRRFGLEWAMGSHFACDIVLHVVTG